MIAITHVAADNVFRVEWEIELAKLECSGSLQTSGVLSNRWECSDEIDDNFYTTRTYTGKLRLRSLFDGTTGITPNSFRYFVIPSVCLRMRRQKITINTSMDGLTLSYTIVDKEVTFAPPYPARTWRYVYTEQTGLDATQFYATLDVTVTGDSLVNKPALIVLATAVIDAYLSTAVAPQGVTGIVPEEYSVTDEAGEGVVWIHGALSSLASRFGEEIQFDLFGKLGKPPDALPISALGGGTVPFAQKFTNQDGSPYNSQQSWESIGNPQTEGNVSAASALAVYLQDPCDNKHRIADAQTGQSYDGVPSPQRHPNYLHCWRSSNERQQHPFDGSDHVALLPLSSGQPLRPEQQPRSIAAGGAQQSQAQLYAYFGGGTQAPAQIGYEASNKAPTQPDVRRGLADGPHMDAGGDHRSRTRWHGPSAADSARHCGGFNAAAQCAYAAFAERIPHSARPGFAHDKPAQHVLAAIALHAAGDEHDAGWPDHLSSGSRICLCVDRPPDLTNLLLGKRRNTTSATKQAIRMRWLAETLNWRTKLFERVSDGRSHLATRLRGGRLGKSADQN